VHTRIRMENRKIWKKEKLVRGLPAFNKSGEELGWPELEKIGGHVHWCWYQNEDKDDEEKTLSK